VRERPYSRKPDFNKKRLTAHLAAEGIAYIHTDRAGHAEADPRRGAPQ
jgi:hypothetical protein